MKNNKRFKIGMTTTYRASWMEDCVTIKIIERNDDMLTIQESGTDIFGKDWKTVYNTEVIHGCMHGDEYFDSRIPAWGDRMVEFSVDDFEPQEQECDRDYSPSAPWLAPGMSIHDFI